MATTPQGEVLTEAHRQAQAQLSATTAILMIRLWPLLGSADSDSTSRWLAAVLAAIRTQRARSADLAAQYASAFRTIELPGVESFRPEPMRAINEEQAIRSMLVMGPNRVRTEMLRQFENDIPRNLEGNELERLLGRTLTPIPTSISQKLAANQARAAARLVRAGERDTIDRATQEDRRARGWVRVTDGDPCFFCAMLASRGPVYKEASFAASDRLFEGLGRYKVHDGCGCGYEVVYYDDTRWPGQSRDYERQWEEVKRANGGKLSLLEWRRYWEGRGNAGTRLSA